MLIRLWIVCVLLAHFATVVCADATKAGNIILVTLDGVRTQEIFGGADKALMHKDFGGVRDLPALEKKFWRDTPEARRAALMPFLWNTIAKEGQIFGDVASGSPVKITNGQYFSYPGYNEILSGFSDTRINSNDKKYNPNTTVLEYLNSRETYKGKTAAWTCWDVFPYIINDKRSGVRVWSGETGGTPPYQQPKGERQHALNELFMQMPPVWKGVCFDVFCFWPAMDAMKDGSARVIYAGFGETDDWAHDKRYDCYLDAAHRCDDYIRQLWETAQSLPAYKDKTAIVITTDHGSGDNQVTWTGHGQKNKTSELGWIAVIGPDTPALGVRKDTPVTQSQVAATVAHLLGEDFTTTNTLVAKPLDGVRK